MIQRKQTIFLLLAMVFGGLMFAFPISTYTLGEKAFLFQINGLFNAEGVELQDASMTVPMHYVLGLLLVLIAVAIAMFKNRARQSRLVRMGYMIILFMIAFMFIISDSMMNYLEKSGEVVQEYGTAAIMPLVMLLMLYLADRGIKQDVDLMRSVDRLR